MSGPASSRQRQDYDYLIKLLLIGDSGESVLAVAQQQVRRSGWLRHGDLPLTVLPCALMCCAVWCVPLLLAGVGKSCILLRFSEDSFTPSFITTIGCVTAAAAVSGHNNRQLCVLSACMHNPCTSHVIVTASTWVSSSSAAVVHHTHADAHTTHAHALLRCFVVTNLQH